MKHIYTQYMFIYLKYEEIYIKKTIAIIGEVISLLGSTIYRFYWLSIALVLQKVRPFFLVVAY